MFRYIASLIILFIIFFLYVHIIKLKEINNHLDIIQVHDPDPDLAYELLSHNQPIVLQKELAFWKDFNKLLGESLATIKQSISEHPEIDYSTSIKMNLEPYNLALSYDWLIDIRQVALDDSNGIFFIKQNNYLQVFGCMSGQFRIIITPPDQANKLEPFTNNVSSVDSTKLLDTDPLELNYIEIIVRQSNLIYIPYGWHYFIYNPGAASSTECVILDCINKSILNVF
jgi:hypothetical protein